MPQRKHHQIGDFSIWIVSPEDPILSKLAWARDSRSETQIQDVKNVLGYLRGQIDINYLRYWAQEIGVDGFLEEILDE
ncbi:MAG: hypothetical protein HPY90_07975 [Syntrophothermus sp.]|uniref:hypothetical protein n=1 Tax=Syntrophothermus sp. TaxID=2736299 RepID=UPI00257DAECC|nr:hypothetical protein [Syntrophothermus sp.]NSW83199.1 hypothetical protein [Syntrophothermus sp.]